MNDEDNQQKENGQNGSAQAENGQAENAQKESKATLPREISKIDYPYYSLKECVEFIKKISSISGRTSATIEMIASVYGVKSNANKLTYLISSAIQFQLITKSEGQITLTERANKILVPTPDYKTEDILKEVCYLPPLYKILIDKYEDRPLPGMEDLANVIYHEGVILTKKDIAAKSFIESVQYAAILTNDRKITRNSKVSIPEINESNKEHEQSDQKIPDKSKEKKVELLLPTASAGQRYLNLTLQNNRIVKIELPEDIKINEVEKIKKMLDIWVVE